MAIVAANLIVLTALSNPLDDSAASGGAIDIDNRIVFADISGTDQVECVSDNAADGMNITVIGRDAAGDIVTETKALNGTTFIVLSTMGEVKSIESAVLASDAAGIVDVRKEDDNVIIAQIPAGERGFHRLFRRSASDPSSIKTRYEKIFIKNTHASLDLTIAQISEVTDASAVIEFAVEDAIDDNESTTNRLTAPTGIGAAGFSSAAKLLSAELTLGDDELPFGSAIGVWIKQTLAAGQAAINEAYSIKIDGNTAA